MFVETSGVAWLIVMLRSESPLLVALSVSPDSEGESG